MRLTYQVTRLNPGNRPQVLNGTMDSNDPLLNAAVLHMSFRQDMVMGWTWRNYPFSGQATMSFIDRQLNDEHLDFDGIIASFPNTMLCYGCVTYTSLQGSTPAKGLLFRFIGRMEPPGPTFHPFPPQPENLDLQTIQPTLQQLQNQDMLFVKCYRLVETAASLIIDQKWLP